MIKLTTLKCFDALKEAREFANKNNNYYIEPIHLFYIILKNQNYLLKNVLYEKLVEPQKIENDILKEIGKLSKKPLPDNFKIDIKEINDIMELYISEDLFNKIKKSETLYSIIDFCNDMYEFPVIKKILQKNNIKQDDFKIDDDNSD